MVVLFVAFVGIFLDLAFRCRYGFSVGIRFSFRSCLALVLIWLGFVGVSSYLGFGFRFGLSGGKI